MRLGGGQKILSKNIRDYFQLKHLIQQCNLCFQPASILINGTQGSDCKEWNKGLRENQPSGTDIDIVSQIQSDEAEPWKGVSQHGLKMLFPSLTDSMV